MRTICPRVDSVSCLVGQKFLGKCVPQTHFPGGHNFLQQLSPLKLTLQDIATNLKSRLTIVSREAKKKQAVRDE